MSNLAVNNDTCSHGFVQASCTNCNLETVSRTFSRLQKENIISVDGREVVINDHDRLNEICHKAR